MSRAPGRIFVSGAAAGIGRAIALRFARAGWTVGAYDRDADGLRELASDTVLTGPLDVREPAQWQAALADFSARAGGGLDVLVNNAGVLISGPFEASSLADHQRVIDVNLRGVINGCHAAFEDLRHSSRACVINLASASAIYGQPTLATYSASKFAVRGLSEALDLEWRAHGIVVRAVWPLFVRTAMIDDIHNTTILGRYGVKLSAEDVAETVWRTVQRPGGVTHRAVGLWTRLLMAGTGLLPQSWTRAICARMSGVGTTR